MEFVFKDANTVLVDGQNAGDIVSVIANYPGEKAKILKAFKDFRKVERDEIDSTKKALQDEKDARKTDAENNKTDKVNSIQKVRELHLAELEAMKLEIEAAKKQRDELIEQFGGHEVVKKMKQEARQAEKAKRLAELEDEKKRLEEEGV
jgi:TusA-related sulfurtransferase